MVAIKICLPAWQNILEWNVPDTDDAMRILQVRDWLNGQGFYDLYNHRLNPPNGGDMHWSRIGDLPLALFQIILTPIFGQETGAKLAIFITPPILGIVFMFLAFKAAYALFESKISAYLMISFCFVSAGIISFFIAGRVDHHSLQLISLLIIIYGILKDTKASINIASFGIALSLCIGFENLPIIGVTIGFIAFKWLFIANKENCSIFCKWLIIYCLIALLINNPIDKIWIAKNDALSIAQVLPIIIGALGLGLSAKLLSGKSLLIRFFALLCVGILILGTAWQFEVLRLPIYYQTEPLLHQLWLNNVSEVIPLIKKDIEIILSYGLFPIIASIFAIIKLIKVRNEQKQFAKWVYICLCLISSTLLIFFYQSRLSGIAAVFAALTAAAIIAETYKTQTLQKTILIAAILNSFTPSLLVLLQKTIAPSQKPTITEQTKALADCNNHSAFSHLRNVPIGKILAPIDLGPRTLLNTGHSVLAAPYHRNQGNSLAYKIFMADKKTAYDLIIENKIEYIAYCKQSAEIPDIIKYTPNGLMNDLINQKPLYLEKITKPKNSDIEFFRVIKQK